MGKTQLFKGISDEEIRKMADECSKKILDDKERYLKIFESDEFNETYNKIYDYLKENERLSVADLQYGHTTCPIDLYTYDNFVKTIESVVGRIDCVDDIHNANNYIYKAISIRTVYGMGSFSSMVINKKAQRNEKLKKLI